MTAFIHSLAQPHIAPLGLFSSLESIYSCFIQSVTAHESVPLGSSGTAGRTESHATRSAHVIQSAFCSLDLDCDSILKIKHLEACCFRKIIKNDV